MMTRGHPSQWCILLASLLLLLPHSLIQSFTLPSSSSLLRYPHDHRHSSNTAASSSSSSSSSSFYSKKTTTSPTFITPPRRRRHHATTSLSSQSPSSLTHLGQSSSSSSSPNTDILIIGAGLAGLSAALHLLTTHPDRHVTIIDSHPPFPPENKHPSGSFAAAGMLAPQSERLPTGELLELCLASRDMYGDFVSVAERWGRACLESGGGADGDGGNGGEEYLWEGDWKVGFSARGGFLAPAFAGDGVATWAPPGESGLARWLDEIQVRELEPELHPEVIGGWWFPEDASVDARRLTCTLRAACVTLGATLQMSPSHKVTSLELRDGHCHAVHLANRRTLTPRTVLLANGAWMRDLLPVPVVPHKGQSLSLRCPADNPSLLRRTLFAQDTYIVPKGDGRIVIGATVEPGDYSPDVTAAGMMHVIGAACGLVPALADLAVEEAWAGLRPTTPDKMPILGGTLWDNLFVAGGYWRNGVLLAPKTGQLMGDLIAKGVEGLTTRDQELLDAFSWERFISKEGGAQLAVTSRYAASMHPVQHRKSGRGISAAVGTELGFYADAKEAKEERKQERDSLLGGGNLEEGEWSAFEKAAKQGLKDGNVFMPLDQDEEDLPRKKEDTDADEMGIEDEYAQMVGDMFTNHDQEEEEETDDQSMPSMHDEYSDIGKTTPTTSEPDAITVGAAAQQQSSQQRHDTSPTPPQDEENHETDNDVSLEEKLNLSSLYDEIKNNKAQTTHKMNEATDNDKPDFNFSIYHIDQETNIAYLVPPNTKPWEMEDLIASGRATPLSDTDKDDKDTAKSAPPPPPVGNGKNVASTKSNNKLVEDETTYDGYVEIQEKNAGATRQEELEKMKAARNSNRSGMSRSFQEWEEANR